MLQDRFCIQSEAQIKEILSVQDMIDCNFENSACNGGYLVTAVDFLLSEGVTTESCMPYQNKKERCTFKCQDDNQTYLKYYCKRNTLNIETDVREIQREIYENGPVSITMYVYEDFLNYSDGVYEQTAGSLMSGHAMRTHGWGHDEDGHLYWLVMNQWSNEWGEKGVVKMKAGNVGVDNFAVSCNPDMIVTAID